MAAACLEFRCYRPCAGQLNDDSLAKILELGATDDLIILSWSAGKLGFTVVERDEVKLRICECGGEGFGLVATAVLPSSALARACRCLPAGCGSMRVKAINKGIIFSVMAG